ncbi:hypothetical protein ZWY2020_036967 [Hordeum vulgare]|nr:hypothetical protein ZWY2020_036967 [Hordeum vulgare]
MTFLFLGWLMVTAQCRLEAGRRSYLDGGDKNATVANLISSLDDGEFRQDFCEGFACTNRICYCCDNLRDRPCFGTFDECSSKCPSAIPGARLNRP